jgi:hypothetical protein
MKYIKSGDKEIPVAFESVEEVMAEVGDRRILHLRADRMGGFYSYGIVVQDRESPSCKRRLMPAIEDRAIAEEVARLAHTGIEAPLC